MFAHAYKLNIISEANTIMKRIFAVILCVLMLCPLLFSAMPAVAVEETKIGYSSPAIGTDVGKTVDLRWISVQFEDQKDCVPSSDIVWTLNGQTVKSVTPTEKGVTTITATAKGKSKTIYVVAKNEGESEYVLYEDDYSVSPDLSKFRVIQQPSGTTFGYDATEGAIYLDASNDGANHMRVLLPSYLDDFGDAIYTARVKITKQTAASRFGALMFRLQDPTGKKIPYMQTAFRYDISASNGLEIAERTAGDSWSVTQKGSVSGVKGGDYFEVTANFCGKTSTSTVNGKTYLTEKSTPYSSGAMGLQVRGARLTVDSIKITLNPQSTLAEAVRGLTDTRDPDSNVVLEPSLITEVATTAQLQALETTLPSIAIFECEVEGNELGVTLDRKFVKLSDITICDRVIPAFRIETSPEAEAFAKYVASLELCDFYIISSSTQIIQQVRSKNNRVYAMFDTTGNIWDAEELRARCIEAGARGAIISDSSHIATRDFVSYLQDRYLVVWQAITEKDVSAVSAINNGVLGLITPDVKATEACFTKYYDKNTLVRTPEIIGHRGNPSTAQENTVAGSVEAFKLGATMVENDIYLMKDGNIVVMHDSTIDRTTTGTGNVVDFTAETIKKYQVDVNTSVPTEPIPLLKDYFEQFAGTDEVLVIELKSSNTNVCAPLAKLIKEYKMEKQVVIIAFNQNVIKAMRAAMPDSSVNFLTSSITANESTSLDVAKQIVDIVVPLNTAYSPSQSVGTLGINLYTDLAVRGITVWNWTVNKQSNFDAYFISGIRGITTNYSQWAGDYIEDFRTSFDSNGDLVLQATTYNGKSIATSTAKLVVIGGTGEFDGKHVTLSNDAQGFFFKITKKLSNGTSYTVVTPVVLKSGNVEAEPIPETTEEVITEAPAVTEAPAATEASSATEPTTEPTEEKGCGSVISLACLAIVPAFVLIIKKKED